MLPAHLTESLNNLGDAAAEMTAEVRRDREQREAAEAAERARRRRAERWMMGLLVALSLVIVGLSMLVIRFEADRRDRSAANAEILRRNAQLSEQIADCTTAGGECYERGAQRTGQAVAELARVQILIEVCGHDPDNDTVAEMNRCVEAEAK
jgi:hypothetical protein